MFETPAERVSARYIERNGGRAKWDEWIRRLHACPDYERFKRGQVYSFTMGRSLRAQVMWDSKVLCERLRWGYRTITVTPESYGHQTTVLLEAI